MASHDSESDATWNPSSPTPRGTVIVLPGRGETAEVYERFGRRIAFDGYVVQALVGRSTAEQADFVAGLSAETPCPVVVVGADTGALEALVLAAGQPVLAGVVLAGTPGSGATGPAGWDDELDVRTACPVHRERLANDVVRGSLADSPVPAALVRAAEAARPSVPVLVIHGDADRIAPVSDALALADRLPAAESIVVVDGRHDALNDVTHRSVAATIVQFLERLRGSADAAPLLRSGAARVAA